MGRRTLYDADRHPFLAARYARDGRIEKEIAKRFGVNISTITDWKNRYPVFAAALKVNKEIVDYEVEDSLLKRAKGFEYEETEVMALMDKDGKERKIQHLRKTKKYVVPDVGAAMRWLTNRQRGKWRYMPAEPISTDDSEAKQFLDALKGKAAEEAWDDEK